MTGPTEFFNELTIGQVTDAEDLNDSLEEKENPLLSHQCNSQCN